MKSSRLGVLAVQNQEWRGGSPDTRWACCQLYRTVDRSAARFKYWGVLGWIGLASGLVVAALPAALPLPSLKSGTTTAPLYAMA